MFLFTSNTTQKRNCILCKWKEQRQAKGREAPQKKVNENNMKAMNFLRIFQRIAFHSMLWFLLHCIYHRIVLLLATRPLYATIAQKTATRLLLFFSRIFCWHFFFGGSSLPLNSGWILNVWWQPAEFTVNLFGGVFFSLLVPITLTLFLYQNTLNDAWFLTFCKFARIMLYLAISCVEYQMFWLLLDFWHDLFGQKVSLHFC